MPEESVHPDPNLLSALVETASAWLDVEYGPRVEAEDASLACENRFTAQALAFAVNQQMSQLTEENLLTWIPGPSNTCNADVALLTAGNIPLVGLQDLLGIVLSGGKCVVVLSSKSPALLPAFVDDWRKRAPDLPVSFHDLNSALNRCDSVVAGGSDRTMDVIRTRLEDAGIDLKRALLRGHRNSVAILEANWRSDDYARLAEDIWLHEGLGCRSVALLFAQDDLSPDALLKASAEFRAVFPPHPASRGALELQRALLSATDQSHAHGENLEFLISRGEAEIQGPGHLRWSPYRKLSDVTSWLEMKRHDIQIIVAKPACDSIIPEGIQIVRPGNAQRPVLGWKQDGIDLIEFLATLS
jgi:Acyl-CoA reductase (LuxC)